MLKFFTTFVPNLKAREMTNGQLRIFVGLIGLALIGLSAWILPQIGSFLVFFIFCLTLFSPDLAGLGLQKSKIEAFGKIYSGENFAAKTQASFLANKISNRQRDRNAAQQRRQNHRRKNRN